MEALRPEAAAELLTAEMLFNAPDEDLRDMVGESHMISLAPPIVRSSSEYQKGLPTLPLGTAPGAPCPDVPTAAFPLPP